MKTDPLASAHPTLEFYDETPTGTSGGLTKREAFAMHVMGDLMGSEIFAKSLDAAQRGLKKGEPKMKLEDYAARVAVLSADALIEALNHE